MRHPKRTRRHRWLAWLLASLALGAVFASYLQPQLVVDLGNRLWSCF